MSGVGEIIAGVAVAASFTQLLAHVLRTSKTLFVFYQDFKDAPSHLKHVQQKLLLLLCILEVYEVHLREIDDDRLLPSNLRMLLQIVLQRLDDDIFEMNQRFFNDGQKRSRSLKMKFKLMFTDREVIAKLMERLRDAERDLVLLTGLLNIKISSVAFASLPAVDSSHSVDQTTKDVIQKPTGSPIARHCTKSTLKVAPRSYVLVPDSWLRKLGFYCSVTILVTPGDVKTTKILLGYKFPIWFSHKAISIYFQLAWSTLCNISIMPGYIRVQNQVALGSPFMGACERGDVRLISQYVREDPEILNNRTICSGKTPLLLAIASQNLEAVKYLLDSGADANMGDDERILPIFSAIGFRDKRIANSTQYIQVPPPTTLWLDMVKLLSQYGASVHENIAGKSMTTAFLSRDSYDPQVVLRYFRLLLEENYTDFDACDDQGRCALANAIRGGEAATSSIDFLAREGVQLSRILADGKNVLHLSASIAMDMKPIKHFYERHGIIEVNRLDQWGWTPLHYAVDSPSNRCGGTCGKVRMLLKKGADPYSKGRMAHFRHLHPSNMFSEPVSPIEYAEWLGCEVYERFVDDMVATGVLTADEYEVGDEDEFVDEGEWSDFYDTKEEFEKEELFDG
ncbi:ankyrin [Melanomma pulvis-pyrius CBS 109.77]|uniref:Ankyrin n=1 Tax=Melanomma pulvis-pyrius CBS 109.77 TaxID=1314802 RepID=A0A6A6XIJ0_9PLEO|nr:ankyrin [Melanomma pulvis-pyrius CBS 109.77]